MGTRLIIIGGGYVGSEIARALEQQMEITLIEPREGFVHTPPMIRALVRPGLIDQAIIPYDRLLKRGRLIRARATAIHPGHIALDNGDTVSGQLMLVATGSHHSGFLKPRGDSLAAFRASHHDAAKRIRAASHIAIAGAGPVGIELAGEIAAAFPDKTVTLVSDTVHLLPGFPARLGHVTARKLAALGINPVHGRAILHQDGDISDGPLELADGRVITCDLILPATGSRGRNELLAALPGVVTTPQGQVVTDPWLRPSDHAGLFVGGDVAATSEAMTIVATMRQIPFLTKTLLHASAGRDIRHLRPYRPWTAAPILLPLGPRHGASFLPVPPPFAPLGVVGDLPTRRLKGADLFIRKYRRKLGQPTRPDGEAR